MRAGRSTPFPQRFDALAPSVDRAFDLETILKVSVGLRWDQLGPTMQAKLLKAFRRFTVATYVANFDSSTTASASRFDARGARIGKRQDRAAPRSSPG